MHGAVQSKHGCAQCAGLCQGEAWLTRQLHDTHIVPNACPMVRHCTCKLTCSAHKSTMPLPYENVLRHILYCCTTYVLNSWRAMSACDSRPRIRFSSPAFTATRRVAHSVRGAYAYMTTQYRHSYNEHQRTQTTSVQSSTC